MVSGKKPDYEKEFLKFLKDNDLAEAVKKVKNSVLKTFLERGLRAVYFDDPSLIGGVSYFKRDNIHFGLHGDSTDGLTEMVVSIGTDKKLHPKAWEVYSEFSKSPFGDIPLNGSPKEIGHLYVPSLVEILKLVKAANAGDYNSYRDRLLAIWHDPVNRALYEKMSGKPGVSKK